MRRLVALAALLACRPPAAQDTTAGETTGPGDPTHASSTGTTDACDGSSDCETDAICVAGYAPGPDGPGGARGPSVCATPDTCIDALDLARWCFDHQGCCGDLRCRPGDGVCEPPGLGVGTETDASTGTGDATGADTGDTSTGTTSTGDASTGTSTGETTGTSTG